MVWLLPQLSCTEWIQSSGKNPFVCYCVKKLSNGSNYSRVLATEMKRYSEAKDIDALSKVHGQIDELKDIMVKNIESVTSRGEHLGNDLTNFLSFQSLNSFSSISELLVNKTDHLRNNAVSFRTTSRTLARTMFWRNVKMYFIIASIIILLIYIIVSISCGGLLWSNCIHKK